MQSFGSSCRRAAAFLGIIVATSASIALVMPTVASAAPKTPKTPPASASSAAKPEIAKTEVAWRKSVLRLPQPKEGCYVSSFPRVEWKPVTCGAPPDYPMPPAKGPAKHFVVGGGGANDFAAHPTGTINAVEGTFASISAGLTESGPVANTGPAVNNAYTLQINTNQFASTACAGSPNANCKGWEQFVYENNATQHRAFIQYWLIKYNTTCPAGGWTQFSFSGGTDIYCFQSTNTVSLPAGQPVSNFGSMQLAAAVSAGSDQVVVTAGANAATRVGLNAVAAAAGWTEAEFNVFGDAGNSSGGGQAAFGANSTIVVKTTVHNGTKLAPACHQVSFTGETNNLTLVGMAAIPTQAAPAIEFTQSNIPGSAAACVAAAGFGDTHLNTFGGLFYDFQATGDFVLAQTGNDFVVQARQVSGAPTWPSASVNKAVATRMGDTRVAVCTEPSRIEVDRSGAEIEDGKVLSLASGVDILRTGNVYVIADQEGNSLRAEVNDTYINASVGLGNWPTKVRGLLANADNGRPNQIETSNGAVLTSPFAFADLYHRYADSWRVPARDSLLSACGDRGVETGIPKNIFTARDLDRKVAKRARAVCTAAGVKQKALLEACTLDVAVIGREDAAKVFVGMRAPLVAGRILPARGNRDGDYDGKH